MRFIPSAQDKWIATDKTAHFGLWFFFASVTVRIGWADWLTALVWLSWGVLWEVMDGYNVLIWNDPRGFSWRDWVADGAGVYAAIMLWP